jgi:phosphoribosylaminoimidazole-succinocarboxamide synthase
MTLSILNAYGQPFDTSTEGAEQVNFGKTKYVLKLSDGRFAIEHKDILTAFDNPEFTGTAPGKWAASAYTSALLFKRLEAKWVRTAHRGFVNANTTLEEDLDMLPFEIIGRSFNVDGNSWEKRHPWNIEIWVRYPEVKYEVGLKYSVVAEDGEVCKDPFLVLDENFEPLLNAEWLPLLTHQQKPGEIKYTKFISPNKNTEISPDLVKNQIERFRKYANQIREMAESVQEATVETYASIGRLNADWKIETGTNKDGDLILWDELELDAMRNVSLKTIVIAWKEYTYTDDLLWQDLYELIAGWPAKVSKIIEARHSWKQHYRDQVKTQKDKPHNTERIAFNDNAAANTTNAVYIPVAFELSKRYWGEVGYHLKLTA